MIDSAFVFAVSEEELASRVLVTTVMATLLIIGIIKCVSIMRRPTTSATCVSSLLLALLVWGMASVLGNIRPAMGPLTRVIVAVTAILVVLAGIVCGCIGLGLYRHGRFIQGRKQAVWGLSLNGIFLLIGLGGYISGMRNSGALGPTVTLPPTEASGARAVVVSEANCRFNCPPRPWVEMSDPKRLNPSATRILRRTMPEWNLILISEPIAIAPEALAQLVKTNLKSATTTATFGPESREIHGGIEFIHFETEFTAQGVAAPLAAGYWVTSKAGISYQFYTFGAKKDRERGLRESREIMSTFRLLDPNRPSTDHEAVTDAQPEAVGFSTQLSKLDWKTWNDAEANAPGQLFAAMHGGTHYFTGYAVPLDELGADIEDVAKAFLRLYGFKYPSDSVTGEPTTVRGAKSALRISAEKNVDAVQLTYRAVVATAERRAFLFVTWQAKAVSNDTRLLDDALGTVEISATPLSLPTPVREVKRSRQADLLHELGLIHADRKEWQRATDLFRQAYAISQQNDATLESLAFTMEQGGEVQAAKDLLDQHADRIPKRRELLTLRARLNDKLANTKAAIDDFAKAFDEGWRDEEDLLYFLNLLVREKKAPDAIRTVEAYLARGSTQRVRRFQAQAYSSSGDLKRAMQLYEDILAKPPFDPISAYELGECANDADDYARSAATAERLLKAGKDNERTRLIEGWSHFGRKEWREAKVSFEKARTFAPEESAVTNALARASAMLGEGDNSAARTELAPIALPAALLEELEKIEQDSPLPSGTSACYLRRASAFSFHVGKPYASTIYRRVRVLDDAGVADFGTLHFQFDPLAEQIFVNRLAVTDESGKVVAEGKPEEQYVVDQSSVSGEGTHRKVLRIIVPGLKPGRTLEYTITRRERANAREFPYQRIICTTPYPVITETVLLEGETARVHAEASAAFGKIATARDGKGVRTWLIRSPPPWKNEPRLPGTDTYLPILHLGDAKATWASESSDYLRQIASVLKPEETIRTLAVDLVKDLKNTEDKVRALTRHVQKNVTYQAVEFGRRARIPKPAERVLTSHYGDCKDQSLLLHQLLSAAGVPSYLALINSGCETQATLPSLDQFDHMVVHVPGLKAAFVDPTNGHFPAGTLPPELFKRKALVLDPAKPRLEAMPDRAVFPADHLSIVRDISVGTSGETTVAESFSLSGYQASAMRNWLAAIKPTERLAAIQGLLPTARWRLQNLDIEALDDDERDLTLKLKYTIPAASSSAGKSAAQTMPAYWEQDYLRAPFLKDRRQPFELMHPLKLDSRATIRLTGLPEQEALRSFARSGGTEFCTWKTQATGPERKGGTATFTFHFEGKSGIFPASRYSEWQGEWNAAAEAWQSPIRQE